MSKFQKEVDEYKKHIQQSGGAYYGNKSQQSIAKPTWMSNKKVERNNVDHPLGGYRIGDLPLKKKVLGTPLELPEFPMSGNIGNKAVSTMEEVLPFLERLGIGFL